ncbi:hypothetical protein GF373_04385, partial [bacterium]|nr:hypothetical protein [bacterium]
MGKSPFLSILRIFFNSFKTRPLVFFLISFLFLILAGEGIFRLFGANQPVLLTESYQFNRHTLWENRANYTFSKEEAEGRITYTTNQWGFRAPAFRKAKPDGETRVFCVGDSTTWGYGVPFEAMFAERLNYRLGTNTLVASCGVRGFSIFQCKQFIKHKLLDFEPDTIVVAGNYNDRRYKLNKNYKE